MTRTVRRLRCVVMVALLIAPVAGCGADPGVRTAGGAVSIPGSQGGDSAPRTAPTTSNGSTAGTGSTADTAPRTTTDTAPRTTADPAPRTSTDTAPNPTAGERPGDRGNAADPDGIGDTLFPALGNPGLDVQHYSVDLSYDGATRRLSGEVGIDVRFTETRQQFTLDSLGPQVDQVDVDGRPARFAGDGTELRITPATPVRAGTTGEIDVRYHVAGDSHPPSSIGLPTGWFDTPGGSFVLNEPDGARSWLPSNDHPSDKATYTFTIHVPTGVTAVANGTLAGHTTTAQGETWVWDEAQPMSTYLIQVLTGDYELIDGTGPHGLPLTSAVLRADVAAAAPYLGGMTAQISFFEQYFGPYPLSGYGLAITDSPPGLAMETQGRSLFSGEELNGSDQESVLAHELAHQWYGDAVSPARWNDVWLNESFATYGQWMWLEHLGRSSVRDRATAALAIRPAGATADPTLNELFGATVYDGGATALEALRLTVGDDAFFEVLRRWVDDNRGESRSTEDFVDLAQRVTGRDLTAFFDEWIFADHQPSELPAAAATSTTSPTIG